MIKALPGYVLVKPIEDDKKSAGGVYLPDSSKDKPMKAEVVDVGGPTVELRRLAMEMAKEGIEHNTGHFVPQKGDIIYHKKWVNETTNYKGEEYLFVRFEDLLGVEDNE